MKRKAEAEPSPKKRRKEYRDEYHQTSMMATMPKDTPMPEIKDVIFTPESIDMASFCGNEGELTDAVERLYANDGRDFNPHMRYLPSMLTSLGKEYALHARGIYYRRRFSTDLVTATRKIWTPSLSRDDEKPAEVLERKSRARKFAFHSRNNETWCKSEYAWEADAWSDVFGCMRDDPSLELDKRKYSNLVPNTDPLLCKLTGKSTLEERIPDATFGLATFVDSDAESQPLTWAYDLHRQRLENLLLHPKYGLYSDPKREDDIALAFPFMVYEAKGWRGDCRQARRQACSAAAFYLDMLDELARVPRPVGRPRVYQTKKAITTRSLLLRRLALTGTCS